MTDTTVAVGPEKTVAVDLGKTKAQAGRWAAGSTAFRDGPGFPGLAAPDGLEAAQAAVFAVAGDLLEGVTRLGLALAGAAAAPERAERLAQRLAAACPRALVTVTSDAVAAHAGALAGGPGVVLALGTGAVVTTMDASGRLGRMDGLGPWLGDEGGGSFLGRLGLRRAARALDGRGDPTVLAARAVARFGSLAGLVAAMAGSGDPAALAASFAPAVVAAAAEGDGAAQECVAAARAALRRTVTAAAGSMPGGEWPFTVVGGLAALWADEAPPPLRFHPPAGTALDGARMLAEGRAPLHAAAAARAEAAGTGAGLDALATEGVWPGLEELDLLPPAAVVRLAVEGEARAAAALGRAVPALGAAAEAIVGRMRAGGRLFVLGAGTSGRLAVLDAAELGPTFSVEPGLVIPLLAGGPGAMLQAAEGAEDDAEAAPRLLAEHGMTAQDAVVGVAASGRTPFVLGGLRHAREVGAVTVAIVNNPRSPLAALADHPVEVLTGAELVAGSTRMTAGTVQKVALNALSTAAMVALGKTYGSRMVDVRATNVKLRRRALRTVCEVAQVSEAAAEAALAEAGGQLKLALLIAMSGLAASAARAVLEASGGRLRQALAAVGGG